MPRGATAVDFAYAVHSDVGDHATAAKVNGTSVPLRTEVHNGDVVEVVTSPDATTESCVASVSCARDGPRSKIRHHLKTMAQTESKDLGEKLLAQALRAEGIENMPAVDAKTQILWDKLLRFTGSKSLDELLVDIGLGKRVASIVARRLGQVAL
jgi:GTP pyrophosphokinase